MGDLDGRDVLRFLLIWQKRSGGKMTTSIGKDWVRFFRNIAAPLVACMMLASCASVLGPREVSVPLHKLQAGLDKRFPVNNRVLELFDIQLSRPHLTLLPETDRVAITMEAVMAPPFLQQSWSGNLALSGRLSLDAARGAIFMSEPTVDRFVVDGMDESRQRQLTKVANLLMNQVVTDVPVYTFRPEDLRRGGVQFVPTRLTTQRDALVLTVEPAK